MKLKRFSSRLLYATVHTLSLLPAWFHYAMSDVIFVLVYHVARYRRRIVERNMQRSFPERSAKEIRQTMRRFYHFFCDYIVENVMLATMPKAKVMKRMEFRGIEAIERSLQDHDFVFVYLGHYGNWEFLASLQYWVSPDIRCAQLYSGLESKAFNDLFLKIRSRYGGDCINKRKVLRALAAYRKQGQKVIMGFIADQTPKWENIHLWMDFLHQDTPVFTGTERIAKQVGAAVFYADVHQPKRGHYVCDMRQMTNDASTYGEHELTAEYMRLLEKSIQQHPHIWLWTHNRWKRQRQAVTSGDTPKTETPS